MSMKRTVHAVSINPAQCCNVVRHAVGDAWCAVGQHAVGDVLHAVSEEAFLATINSSIHNYTCGRGKIVPRNVITVLLRVIRMSYNSDYIVVVPAPAILEWYGHC